MSWLGMRLVGLEGTSNMRAWGLAILSMVAGVAFLVTAMIAIPLLTLLVVLYSVLLAILGIGG